MSARANDIPRPEHPRPQFQRDPWINLNGPWSYTFDPGKSGSERGLAASHGFDSRIIVPFCPESELSGVGHTDFIEMMWYHRGISIPAAWKSKRIILHFGAVDFETDVHIDGKFAGRHWGGQVSFELDITRFVTPGKTHDLVLKVRDETRSKLQPAGKQSPQLKSFACMYTRTTGIWQTVWLEAVEPAGLRDCQIVADLDGGRFIFTPRYHAAAQGLKLRVVVSAEEERVGEATVPALNGGSCAVALSDIKPWSPSDPFLYDVSLELLAPNGATLETVRSYAGLRKIHVEGNRICLNNSPIYLRLVLDQGFYPDGIWTAPTDQALKHDIELSMRAGFNGARLHQKVFEERFHYWADRLGYLTWGESSSWGVDPNTAASTRAFLAEWREIIVRDRNHPSIIAWTPFNETGNTGLDGREHNRTHVDACDICHDLDPTRPVNDASGYVHVKTDLWTVHDYTQDPVKFKEILAPKPDTGIFRKAPTKDTDYTGQPYFVDEYGGIKWIPTDRRPFADNSWGYGDAPKSLAEFYERLEKLTEAILSFPHMSGYCYTQLTDVEQEQNGVYTYDRADKFDMKKIAAVFGRNPPDFK